MTATGESPYLGERLPPFARAGNLESWNRYAAVNDEFVPIHMDRDAGRAAGFDGAIGMGRLQWSYLHNLLRGWMRGRDRILNVQARFSAPLREDSIASAQGVVATMAPDGGAQRVGLDLWIEDERGTRLLSGTATVLLHGRGLA
jgi:acyl dehydratase